MATKRESLNLSDEQIENLLYSVKHKIVNKKGRLDVSLIAIVAEEDFGVKLGHNRQYKMKKRLKFHHPQEFL